jgi:lipopolysaccharide transport system permease protein
MTGDSDIRDAYPPLVIRPPKSFTLGWKELWEYRELLYFFTWKEIKVRYKQAALGVLWTWLQPLSMMVVFTLVLNKGLGLSTGGIPAPLYYLSGLLIWNLFQQGVSHAAQSMVSHSHIIKKIYFPRLVIPISAIGTATFDFVISLIIFVAFVLGYHIQQPLPISIPYMMMAFGLSYLVTAVTAFSVGTLLSAINVKYRDVRYVLPFIVQSVFFITPVMYDTRTLDNIWAQRILELNPLQYAIQLVRASLAGNDLSVFCHFSWHLPMLLILLYFCAIYIFRKTEAYFADIV